MPMQSKCVTDTQCLTTLLTVKRLLLKIQIWPNQKSGIKEFEVHSEDSQCVGKHLSQADQSSHETRSYV